MALEKLIQFVSQKNSPSFLAALCAVNLKKGLSYMTSTQKGDLIYLRKTDK